MNGSYVMFIAVITHAKRVTKKEMYRCTNDHEILNKIGTISPTASIERVFSVDTMGNVTHYRVVFDGRLKLERTEPAVISPEFNLPKFTAWVSHLINATGTNQPSIHTREVLSDLLVKIEAGEFDA